MKYIVMECKPAYAVILDEEGRFIKVANLNYETGQLLIDPIFVKSFEKNNIFKKRLIRGFAAIASCLLLFLCINYYQNYMLAYSHILISINPELKLDINKQGKVLKVTGVNEDGKILIKGYLPNGKDKNTVSSDLISRAIDLGYLKDGGNVYFIIDTPDNEFFNGYRADLNKTINGVIDNRVNANISIISSKGIEPSPAPKEHSVLIEDIQPKESTAPSHYNKDNDCDDEVDDDDIYDNDDDFDDDDDIYDDND